MSTTTTKTNTETITLHDYATGDEIRELTAEETIPRGDRGRRHRHRRGRRHRVRLRGPHCVRPMSLGERLKRLRLDRDLTQAELADRAGMAQPNLARLESGARDATVQVGTVEALVAALGCSFDDLLGSDS